MDGGRGWAEFGPSLTIIRCCLHPFFTPYAFLFASHYSPSIDSTLIQIDRVKRVYVTRVWRRVNRSKIDREIFEIFSLPRKINSYRHRFSVNSFVRFRVGLEIRSIKVMRTA